MPVLFDRHEEPKEKSRQSLHGKVKRVVVKPKKKERRTTGERPVALGILEYLGKNARSSGRFRFFQKMANVFFHGMFANL